MKFLLALLCFSAVGFTAQKSEAKLITCFDCTVVYDSSMSSGSAYEAAGDAAASRGDYDGAMANYAQANQAYSQAWQAPEVQNQPSKKEVARQAAVRASNKYWIIDGL